MNQSGEPHCAHWALMKILRNRERNQVTVWNESPASSSEVTTTWKYVHTKCNLSIFSFHWFFRPFFLLLYKYFWDYSPNLRWAFWSIHTSITLPCSVPNHVSYLKLTFGETGLLSISRGIMSPFGLIFWTVGGNCRENTHGPMTSSTIHHVALKLFFFFSSWFYYLI